jgi:hypothetical protein
MELKAKSEGVLTFPDREISVAVLDYGQAVITQNGMIELVLGADLMDDDELVEQWRSLMFYQQQTHANVKGVVFENLQGEQDIGYNVKGVIQMLFDLMQGSLGQEGILGQIGDDIRCVLFKICTIGAYLLIEQNTQSRVAFM